MKKDKQKVLDEVWTEDRVRSFLDSKSYDGTDENFHMLLKAYQSMRASDFELFVQFFGEENRDVNARGKDGRVDVRGEAAADTTTRHEDVRRSERSDAPAAPRVIPRVSSPACHRPRVIPP